LSFLFSEKVYLSIMNYMIYKKVTKHRLSPSFEIRQNLKYWLTRTPQERLAAVDFLRRQIYGDTERLQRTARVTQRPQG
jgi:hypothetical protein